MRVKHERYSWSSKGCYQCIFSTTYIILMPKALHPFVCWSVCNILWLLLCPSPFTDLGHGLRLCAKFCLSRFILSHSGGEKSKFCHFLDIGILWCHQLAVYWKSLTQAHNCKPYPMQRYQICFCTYTPWFVTLLDVIRQLNPIFILLVFHCLFFFMFSASCAV